MQRGDAASSAGKKVLRKANIYVHPELSPGDKLVGPGTNVLGDIHANAITFLFHLVDNDVLRISKEDYQQLVDLYFKVDPTKEDFDKFDQIISRAEVGTNPRGFRLMGDDLADRGTNDYFMLLLYKNLIAKKVPFEVILSNHTIEFLRAYLQHIDIDNPTKGQRYITSLSSLADPARDQDSSLVGLAKAIARGHVKPTQVKEIVEGYKRNLKLLNYDIDRSTKPPRLTLYTHAPVGIDVVERLAKKFLLLEPDHKISSIEELTATIDKINQHFSQNMDDILKHFDIRSASDPLTFILWNRFKEVNPFENNDKMKFPDGSTLDLKYVHGHDGKGVAAPAYEKFVENLDNENGKGDREPTPTDKLVFYHSPQPLKGASLKAEPAVTKGAEPKPLEKPPEPPSKVPPVKTATAPSIAPTQRITIDPITAVVLRSTLIRGMDEKNIGGFFFPLDNPQGLHADLEKIFAGQSKGNISVSSDKKTKHYEIVAGQDIYNDLKKQADAIKKSFLIGLAISITEEHAGLLTSNLDEGKLTLSCSDPKVLKQIIDTLNQFAVAQTTPIFVLSSDGKIATFDMAAAANIYLLRMNFGGLDDSTGRLINRQIIQDLSAAVAQIKADLKLSPLPAEQIEPSQQKKPTTQPHQWKRTEPRANPSQKRERKEPQRERKPQAPISVGAQKQGVFERLPLNFVAREYDAKDKKKVINEPAVKKANKEQALAILQKVQRQLGDRPSGKVGIIYSANHDQTEAIHREYKAGGKWHAGISGSNQAEVMALVEAAINDPKSPYYGLREHFYILPVTTMASSGPTTDEWLQKDLQAISDFAAAGGAVLGWQNQDSKEDFAIGGGVALKHGYISPEQRQYIQDNLHALEGALKAGQVPPVVQQRVSPPSDVLEVAPPAKLPAFTKDVVRQLDPVIVPKMETALHSDSRFADWKLIDSADTAKSYKIVQDGAGKDKIEIHPTKFVVLSADEDTMIAALKCFQAANPPPAMPNIKTENQQAKDLWVKVCKDFYKDPAIDWDNHVALKGSAATAAPAAPDDEEKKPATTPKL